MVHGLGRLHYQGNIMLDIMFFWLNFETMDICFKNF